jgi:hypothetical protein
MSSRSLIKVINLNPNGVNVDIAGNFFGGIDQITGKQQAAQKKEWQNHPELMHIFIF